MFIVDAALGTHLESWKPREYPSGLDKGQHTHKANKRDTVQVYIYLPLIKATVACVDACAQ